MSRTTVRPLLGFLLVLFLNPPPAHSKKPPKTPSWLETTRAACVNGNGQACYAIGVLLRSTKQELAGFQSSDEEERLKSAIDYFLKGCGHKMGEACAQAGANLRLAGRIEEAADAFGSGCSLGDEMSCFRRDAAQGRSNRPTQVAQAPTPVPTAPPGPSKLTGAARSDFVKATAQKVYRRLGSAEWSEAKEICENAPCPGETWLARPADLAGETSELHIVGAYEPSKVVTDGSGRVLDASTKVKVLSAEKPVVLYLSSYHSMNWKVVPGPGVKIKRVYLSGYEKSEAQVPPGTEVRRLEDGDLYYSLRGESSDPRDPSAALGKIRELTGTRAASFQGNYSAVDVTIPLVPDQKLIADIYAEIDKLAATERTSVPRALKGGVKDGRVLGLLPEHRQSLAPKIPSDARQIVWSPFDKTYYGVSSHQIFTMSPGGAVSEFQVPAGIPRHTWLGGVAVDEKTKRIYFMSTWHAGHHHAYDPVRKQWFVFEIDNNGSAAVAFHKKSGRMYGVTFPFVYEYDEKLKTVRSWNLKQPSSPGASPRVHHAAIVEGSWVVVDEGSDLMIVQSADTSGRQREPSNTNGVPEVYFLNPATGVVRVAGGGD